MRDPLVNCSIQWRYWILKQLLKCLIKHCFIKCSTKGNKYIPDINKIPKNAPCFSSFPGPKWLSQMFPSMTSNIFFLTFWHKSKFITAGMLEINCTKDLNEDLWKSMVWYKDIVIQTRYTAKILTRDSHPEHGNTSFS